jgi:hypothetical protein
MPVIVIIAIIGLIVWLSWSRSNELFYVSIREGWVYLDRGNAPEGYLRHIRDVAQSPWVTSGHVRGIKGEHGVEIQTGGLSEGQCQRLRNAHNLTSQAGFRAGENPVNKDNFWRAWNIARILRLFR